MKVQFKWKPIADSRVESVVRHLDLSQGKRTYTIALCAYTMYTIRYLYYTQQHVSFYILNRPKHPTKVHVCAGISRRGITSIEGIMKAELFIDILDQTLHCWGLP